MIYQVENSQQKKKKKILKPDQRFSRPLKRFYEQFVQTGKLQHFYEEKENWLNIYKIYIYIYI